MSEPLFLRIYSAPHDLVGTAIDDSATSEYFETPHVEHHSDASWSFLYAWGQYEVWFKAYKSDGRQVIELFFDPPSPPAAAATLKKPA